MARPGPVGGPVLTEPNLTPLKKRREGTDARPVAAESIDSSLWSQGLSKLTVDAVRRHVSPQQLAVGVSGGMEIQIWGWRLLMEEWDDKGGNFVVTSDDQINAHNAFNREEAVLHVRSCAVQNTALAPLALATDTLLRVQKRIMGRSSSNPTGLIQITTSSQGGPQGNPITNQLYPMSTDPILKDVETKHAGVVVRAFQDDVNLGGLVDDVVGINSDSGARQTLKDGLSTERHPGKAKGYGLTIEARAKLPPDMAQPFFVDPDDDDETKHFGIEVGGAALSTDPIFIRFWLRAKAKSICDVIESVSKDLSMIDAQSAHAVNVTSMQTLADYVMATHLPSDTREFAATVDEAMRTAHARASGTDLLSPGGHSHNDTSPEDPTLVRDRSLLKAKAGGAAFRPLHSRMHSLNSILNSVPQMIDSNSKSGVLTKGYFNMLATVLGEGSFDEKNEATRWDHFFASGSAVANEFQAEHARQKGINDSVRQAIIDVSGEALPASLQASVFGTPIASFGAGMKKVQKAVMEEIGSLQATLVHMRMGRLSIDDPRRKPWLEQHGNSFATQLMTGIPVPGVSFSPKSWQVAVQRCFGVPLAVLRNHLGQPIDSGGADRTLVDAYGNNILGLSKAKGGGTAAHHNKIISAVTHSLQRGGIPTKATNVNGGCKHVFQKQLVGPGARAPTPEDHDILSGIIPDMIVNARNSTQGGSLGSDLGGATHIVDFKTLAGVSNYHSNGTGVTPSGVIQRRQGKVHVDYLLAFT